MFGGKSSCSVGRIKEMDENGIELQVLSFTSPGPQISDKAAEGEALAREANEYVFEVSQQQLHGSVLKKSFLLTAG